MMLAIVSANDNTGTMRMSAGTAAFCHMRSMSSAIAPAAAITMTVRSEIPNAWDATDVLVSASSGLAGSAGASRPVLFRINIPHFLLDVRIPGGLWGRRGLDYRCFLGHGSCVLGGFTSGVGLDLELLDCGEISGDVDREVFSGDAPLKVISRLLASLLSV